MSPRCGFLAADAKARTSLCVECGGCIELYGAKCSKCGGLVCGQDCQAKHKGEVRDRLP